MPEEPAPERSVLIHTAGSSTEAMVIRGLLESNGITSPATTETDPFPMREPPSAIHGVEIMVRESQAEQARQLIQDYLDDSELSPMDEEPSEETGGGG